VRRVTVWELRVARRWELSDYAVEKSENTERCDYEAERQRLRHCKRRSYWEVSAKCSISMLSVCGMREWRVQIEMRREKKMRHANPKPKTTLFWWVCVCVCVCVCIIYKNRQLAVINRLRLILKLLTTPPKKVVIGSSWQLVTARFYTHTMFI